MANLKNLKELPSYNINIISILEKIMPLIKPKYIELLTKLMLSNLKVLDEDIAVELRSVCDEAFMVNNLSPLERRVFWGLLSIVEYSRLNQFIRFIDFNEKSLIAQNDLSTYKNFVDIERELNKTEIKLISKEMESQVFTLYDDDEWLFIKPLTYDSSKKYGSNTKWCTTSFNNPEYFFSYTDTGNLIYCINKINGYKVAVFKELKSHRSIKETTFYDELDNRIDSIDCEIPYELFKILRNDIRECVIPNADLIDSDIRIKDKEKYITYEEKSSNGEMPGMPHPIPLMPPDDLRGHEEAGGLLDRAFDIMENDTYEIGRL